MRILLTVSAGVFNRCYRTEKAMLFLIASSAEVESGCGSRSRTTAEGNAPEAVDLDCMVARVIQAAEETSRYRIENQDLAATKLTYKNIVAVNSKVAGGEGHTPRCIEPRSVLKPAKKPAVRGKYVYESQAGTIDFIMFFRILLGESDIEISANVLDVEGSIALRKSLIFKSILPFRARGESMCRRSGHGLCENRRHRGKWPELPTAGLWLQSQRP